CIQIGHYPKLWKKAIVKILKKPNKSNYNHYKSYRPISLTSNVSKILDKLLLNQILKFALIQNNVFSHHQHGFLPTKSTTSALKEIIDSAISHKSSHLTAILAIDISEAVDNTWWPSILYMLDQHKFPAQIIRLNQSHLSNRSVSFTYQNFTSHKSLTKGCPQGGPISPILWLIIINVLLCKFNIPNTKVVA